MSFICGWCHKEHKVPTYEEEQGGQPCIDALVRERDALKRQVAELRPVVEAAVDLAGALKEKRGEEGGIVVLLNKVKQYAANHVHRYNTIESNPKKCLDCGAVVRCDKQYAATEDTYGHCGLESGHDGSCGRG